MDPASIPDEHPYAFARPYLPDPVLDTWIGLAEHALATKDQATRTGQYDRAREIHEFRTRLLRCAQDYCALFGTHASARAGDDVVG